MAIPNPMAVIALAWLALACGSGRDAGVVIRFPGSAVGAEGELLAGQLERFMAERPEMAARALIFVGLAEGIAIYGLIIAIMILGRI